MATLLYSVSKSIGKVPADKAGGKPMLSQGVGKSETSENVTGSYFDRRIDPEENHFSNTEYGLVSFDCSNQWATSSATETK